MDKFCEYLLTKFFSFVILKMGCLFSKRLKRDEEIHFDIDKYIRGEYPPETDKMGHNDVFYSEKEEKAIYDRYK